MQVVVDPSLPDVKEEDVNKIVQHALTNCDEAAVSNLLIAAGEYDINGTQYVLKHDIHHIDPLAASDENNKNLRSLLKQQLHIRKIVNLKMRLSLQPQQRYIKPKSYPVTMSDKSKKYIYLMRAICIVNRRGESFGKHGVVLEIVGNRIKKIEDDRSLHERIRIAFAGDSIVLTPQPHRAFIVGKPLISYQHEVATLQSRYSVYKLKSPIEVYGIAETIAVILPVDFSQGKPLSEYLKKHREKLSIPALCDLSLAVLDEYHSFQDAGASHRNITLDNIIIREEGGKYTAKLTNLSSVYNKSLEDDTILDARAKFVNALSSDKISSTLGYRTVPRFPDDDCIRFCIGTIFGAKTPLENKYEEQDIEQAAICHDQNEFESLFVGIKGLREVDKAAFKQILLQANGSDKESSSKARQFIFALRCKYASGVAQALDNSEYLVRLMDDKNLADIVSSERINTFCGLVNFYEDATCLIKDKFVASNPLYKNMKDTIAYFRVEPVWINGSFHTMIKDYFEQLEKKLSEFVKPLSTTNLFVDLQSRIKLIESPLILDAELFILQYLTVLAMYRHKGDKHLNFFHHVGDYLGAYLNGNETGQARAQRIINSLLVANNIHGLQLRRYKILDIIKSSLAEKNIGDKFRADCRFITGESIEVLARTASTFYAVAKPKKQQTMVADANGADLSQTHPSQIMRFS